MNISRASLCLAVALLVPAGLHAQQDTLPVLELEPLVVTATRAPTLRTRIPQKVDVVTREDLRRAGEQDLAAVLKRQTSVDVIEYPGLLSGVGIRGFRPQISGINQRTLLLIDGRPAGTTNLALIDPWTVERVEVLKGPASALYGSAAMGGVVNVVTRRSRGPLHATAAVGYGSWQTREGNLAAGGNLASGLDFDLSLSAFRRGADYRVGDGNTFRDLLGDGTVERTFANDSTARAPDPGDGQTRPFSEYGSQSGNLRLGVRLGEHWHIDARGNRFQADGVQNPGDIGAPYDGRSLKDVNRTTGDLALTGALPNHAVTARVFASAENGDYYNRPDSTNFISFRTPIRWRGLQVQDVASEGTNTLTYGVDYAVATARSEVFGAPGERSAPYSPDARIRSRAAFAEARLATADERWVATLGGRLDGIRFEVLDAPLLPDSRAGDASYTAFNPSAGLQYATPEGVRVHGTIGRAFVAPEAFSVAGYAEQRTGAGTVALTRGDPELRPENSVTWDAGLAWFRPERGLDADLTYFDTRVRDRITTRRTLPDALTLTLGGDTVQSVTVYRNADRARIRGVEGRLGYGLLAGGATSLRLFANATRILRAEEITATPAGETTQPIHNVADLTVDVGADADVGRWSGRVSGRYVGERTDTDFTDFANVAQVAYPRFLTVDLYGGVRLGRRYRLGAYLDNLTDENYYEVRGYPLPGRSLRVQVSAEM